jgi:hypothetical protein
VLPSQDASGGLVRVEEDGSGQRGPVRAGSAAPEVAQEKKTGSSRSRELRRQSPKYQALALDRLGQIDEASASPWRPGQTSCWQAQAALSRITLALPTELRAGYASKGRLTR